VSLAVIYVKKTQNVEHFLENDRWVTGKVRG